MITLGIETSCDDTAAAIVADGRVLSSVVSSQDELHQRYRGVVPEIASRAHTETIGLAIRAALDGAAMSPADIEAVAVTVGPGLIGALLVGMTAAKVWALALDVPLIGVDHLAAHVHAARLADPGFGLPYVALLASGGHTAIYLYHGQGRLELLGRTRDDAAGEAFDKVAAMLALDYPGGPSVSRLAATGRADRLALPRPMLGDGTLDFSFSGIKTAVLYKLKGQNARRTDPDEAGLQPADVAAGFEQAVVDVLAGQLIAAVEQTGCPRLSIGGGVAANRRLRETLESAAAARGWHITIPPPALCTDNAAMVAGLGEELLAMGKRTGLDVEAYANC